MITDDSLINSSGSAAVFRACCKYVNTVADPPSLPLSHSLTLLLTSFITIVSSSVMSPSQVSMEARREGKALILIQKSSFSLSLVLIEFTDIYLWTAEWIAEKLS